MEETLTADVAISNPKYTTGGKTYSFYCKRPTRASAEAVRDDLIQNGYDAVVRRTVVDRHNCFEVWWRKEK